ncbi:MAG: hypothetical protein FIA82_12710 [Melioribacter sp.]|nr:hypothetical protein [Melioribacter sp.]
MKFDSSQINSSNTWQIGTGDGTRSYFDIFLKYGVALVGPGDPGREGEEKTIFFYKEHPYEKNWGKTLSEVKKDQWIIARKGKSTILAIGKVTKEIQYSNLFADVEGWDLQHYVNVQWYIPKNSNETIQFNSNLLSQSTLQGCYKREVYDKIYQTYFEERNPLYDVETVNVPPEIAQINFTKMLIDEGLRIQDAENIALTIQRIIILARWYIANDKNTLEAEIIAFLILPFLTALGWSEQKTKLEYWKIDIALFRNSFKGDYNISPEIIVEAKAFANGLSFTNKQILNYANKFPSCKIFIATNGFRYKIFIKEKDQPVLKGYLNLLRLNERNALYDVPLTTTQSLFSISNFNRLYETNN